MASGAVPAVSGAFDLAEPWLPKFPLAASARFASGGGAVARHMGVELRQHGLEYRDVEPAPEFMSADDALRFGYGFHSARFGTLQTSRQLLQLAQRAFLGTASRSGIWKAPHGRWVDAFRPTTEDQGFGSAEEVLAMRQSHLAAVRQLFLTTDVLLFTLGLSAAWEDVTDGLVYPSWPGKLDSEFIPQKYRLRQLAVTEIQVDLEEFMQLVRSYNPDMRMILSISPLTEPTHASDDPRLRATAQSQAILQAAATALRDSNDAVDFFPSVGRGTRAENEPAQTSQDIARAICHAMAVHVQAPRIAARRSTDMSRILVPGEPFRMDDFCDYMMLAHLGSSVG